MQYLLVLGKNWRMLPDCRKIQIGMSRCLDTSSTTQMAKMMGKRWRLCDTSWTKLGRSPISWIAMGDTIRRSFVRTWMGGSAELGMDARSSETSVVSASICGWPQKWLEWSRTWIPCGRNWKNADIDERTSFLDHVYLGCTQRECKPNETIIEKCTKMFGSRISVGATEKLPGWQKLHAQTGAWSYDMEGHAQKCVEQYCELANKKVVQLYKVSHPCLDDHQLKQEELESVGELSVVCSRIVLKWSYLTRIGRLDILWSVNKLARSVSKWTQACDKRLASLIFYTHHTNDSRQYCHVRTTAQHGRLALFQDTQTLLATLRTQNQPQVVSCFIFVGSRTFVPVCWMCKEQSSVLHSSTESEVIFLDAGPRMYGLPALDLWDIVTEVIHSINDFSSHTFWPPTEAGLDSKTKTQHVTKNRRLTNWVKRITYPPTHILLKESLSCTFFLKTMKLWSKWSSKTEVPERDMRQEFTQLLLIGCLTESTWNPRLKSNMWTPKTNSLTFWPKVIGAMSKRGQDVTSGGDSVQRGCLAQISGSLVNLGTDDERKIVGLASGNWRHSNSNFDKRRLILTHRNLGRKTKPLQKVRRTP